MFTGIVKSVGRVKSIDKAGGSGKIEVYVQSEVGSLDMIAVTLGDSIAIEGVCLTVTALSGDSFTADISSETLKLTTLGALKSGDAVNLEGALTLATPLGGHLVTGHIDATGTIKSRSETGGGNVEILFTLPEELLGQVVRKGSIAIDGISLTVASIEGRSVRVALIRHTLRNTTLGAKKDGTEVNIETDIIGKYVERMTSQKKEVITEGFLAEHGFFNK